MNRTPRLRPLSFLLTGMAAMAVITSGTAVIYEPAAAVTPALAEVAPEGSQPRPVYVSLTATAPDFSRESVTSTPGQDTRMEMLVAAGQPPVPETLARPVTAAAVTSPYGVRTSPINGNPEFHNGVDFAAGCGTALHASAGGTVVAAGVHNGTGGNRVEIQHSSGLMSTYSHMEGISVSAGQELERGQIIGSVGSTGASTGCHLHYEVWKDGATVDPMKWL